MDKQLQRSPMPDFSRLLARLARTPFLWFGVAVLALIVGLNATTIDTRRATMVVAGPLLLVTTGWLVVWLGLSSRRYLRGDRKVFGWIRVLLTVAAALGFLALAFFVLVMINFALFWRS